MTPADLMWRDTPSMARATPYEPIRLRAPIAEPARAATFDAWAAMDRRDDRRKAAHGQTIIAKATVRAYFDRCTAAGIAPSLAGQFRSNRNPNPPARFPVGREL